MTEDQLKIKFAILSKFGTDPISSRFYKKY